MATLRCFAIMPFAEEFDAVFGTVKAAANEAMPDDSVDCFWLKDEHAAGRITDDILDSLTTAAFCVADVTGRNANVMWETGYAMALGKPTLLIGQSVKSLPFDLQHHRVLQYEQAGLDHLKKEMKVSIQQTLHKYALLSSNLPPSGPVTVASQCVVVTGSMRAEPARAKRRLQALLTPHLGAGTTWYCGGRGVVDELAVDFLLANRESTTVVGYQRFDLSEPLRRLVADGKVGFIDASLEAIPKGLSAPSERDALFCARADLVVLLWDGRSSGSKRLFDFFQVNGTSVLLGSV